MSDRYRAHVFQEPSDWAQQRVRIIVERDHGEYAPVEVLQGDGTWRSYEPGVVVEPTSLGFVLPAESVEAIAAAIERWQGHANHADTEARVLREWLAVEQRRVDKLLDSGGRS